MPQNINWLERAELLLGSEKINQLKNTTIAVVGLGGVGAYAAEMLARAGVGRMIIADADVVTPTNKNRQLLALESTMGLPKVVMMYNRLKDINPDIELITIGEYITLENVESLLTLENVKIDYIVDAIDTLSPKISLIQFALASSIKIVSSMGAGAKTDATKIKIKDISKSFNCPLAYMLRKRLRKVGISKGFRVVFSEELPDGDAIVPVEELNKKSMVGTISYLPPVFGCICAQAVLEDLLSLNQK
ncbi:MAG: tRNA threonylcarbamoyladenosine dehydratase [Bacteroidetes bacterium HGW-Bacteroidetes-14]|nr:MAG: tRNA threonylcarbamoyladenosine dehydratase [Bacteroidetes bacterium HGW-Bacteroidetes-14]